MSRSASLNWPFKDSAMINHRDYVSRYQSLFFIPGNRRQIQIKRTSSSYRDVINQDIYTIIEFFPFFFFFANLTQVWNNFYVLLILCKDLEKTIYLRIYFIDPIIFKIDHLIGEKFTTILIIHALFNAFSAKSLLMATFL